MIQIHFIFKCAYLIFLNLLNYFKNFYYILIFAFFYLYGLILIYLISYIKSQFFSLFNLL